MILLAGWHWGEEIPGGPGRQRSSSQQWSHDNWQIRHADDALQSWLCHGLAWPSRAKLIAKLVGRSLPIKQACEWGSFCTSGWMSEAVSQWRRDKYKYCWQVKWTWLPCYMLLHLLLLGFCCKFCGPIWRSFCVHILWQQNRMALCASKSCLTLLPWQYSTVYIGMIITIETSMLLLSTFLLEVHVI